MTKEQILQQQVEALEKLLGFKDQIIKSLESQLAEEKAKPKYTFPAIPPVPETKPQVYGPTTPYSPFILTPSCVHEYEVGQGNGLASMLRRCKKCGQFETFITYTNNGK
jgi:hypothetical protein